MPINRKMMKSMAKIYGKKKGKKVYYAVEMKRKQIDHEKTHRKMMMGK